MSYQFWTDEMHVILVNMAAQGATGSQIAKTLGVSRSSVLGRAHRAGITLSGGVCRSRAGGRKPVPNDDKLLALAAYFAGATFRDAGKAIGVTASSVMAWVRNCPELSERAREIAVSARVSAGASHALPTVGKYRKGYASVSVEAA